MKKFVIFDADGNAIIDSLPKNIYAQVRKVGKTPLYKIVVTGDNSLFFNGGVYSNLETATAILLDLQRTLKKARRGNLPFDAVQLPKDDLSALELLEEFELAGV